MNRDLVGFQWRGEFSSEELNALHAEAFGHRVYTVEDWDWRRLVQRHSLGWVVARDGDRLAGFVNVPWDGLVHAWIQDVIVAKAMRHQGIGVGLVEAAREAARVARCDWLHVDFDPELEPFYTACGFLPTSAGLIALRQ